MFCRAIISRRWSASDRNPYRRHLATIRATISRFSSWCFICCGVMGTKNRFSSRSGSSLEHLVLGAAQQDRLQGFARCSTRLR